MKEGKFGQGLEGCIRSDAEEVWEELSGLRGGQSEAWRWEHARCILGDSGWSSVTKEVWIDLTYTI